MRRSLVVLLLLAVSTGGFAEISAAVDAGALLTGRPRLVAELSIERWPLFSVGVEFAAVPTVTIGDSSSAMMFGYGMQVYPMLLLVSGLSSLPPVGLYGGFYLGKWSDVGTGLHGDYGSTNAGIRLAIPDSFRHLFVDVGFNRRNLLFSDSQHSEPVVSDGWALLVGYYL